MKTWKIVGITGLLLAALMWSGTAQARRYDNHSSFRGCQNQRSYSNYRHHEPRWAAGPERDGFRHDQGRHRGWERGNHYGWEQRHNRMAARNSRW
jgi:hypothetical protein